VTKYVPEAPLHGRRVTVRQLLDHTSGIYSFTSLPEADANERLDLTQDQVLALFKDKPPLFDPWVGWRYDNSAFLYRRYGCRTGNEAGLWLVYKGKYL
jgi:CubicO group peptidase (beta-lactamase class C family)